MVHAARVFEISISTRATAAPRRLQVGPSRGELALGLEVLRGELLRRVELDFTLLDECEGFTPASAEVARIHPHHHIAFRDAGAAFGPDRDDAPVDFRAQGDRPRRLGAPVEYDGTAHGLRSQFRNPHLDISLALQRRFLMGRRRRRRAAGLVTRPYPRAHPHRDREGDDYGMPSLQEGFHGQREPGRRAMKSISMRAPRARAVTPMQVRAGRRSGGK